MSDQISYFKVSNQLTNYFFAFDPNLMTILEHKVETVLRKFTIIA